ncbi:hypothetical protein SDC9_175177 [bioreactor metagenome]|uniref:Uncharacterized protein n=1 Tax=bioreactor metagenome TaxID=1076179 RepID=A0A645GVS9_9ZZZZ
MGIPLHAGLVVCCHMFFYGRVKLGQTMEGLLADTGIYTMVDELYLILDKGFVARFSDPGRCDCEPVMVGHIQ